MFRRDDEKEREKKKVNIKFDLAEGKKKKKSSENWVNEQFCGHDKMPGSEEALL